MIASELLMLNISNAGDTVARPTLKFFETFRSSCAMRSTNDALYGTTATVSDVGAVGEPMNVAGRMMAPAGHGAGQVVGYRVVPRVITRLRVVAVVVADGLSLLCSAPLSCTPHFSCTEPASFRFLLNG